MTKPHATELPTCATANEFSGQRTQGSFQFVFHCPSFANGPVLIFKTKTLHIVEGQVPGSTQCELFDLWTFKSFTASVLLLLSLSCWQSKKEQKAFQTLPICYLSLLKSILAASLPSTPSTVRAPTDQLLLGTRCWELDLKEFGNGKTQQLQATVHRILSGASTCFNMFMWLSFFSSLAANLIKPINDPLIHRWKLGNCLNYFP